MADLDAESLAELIVLIGLLTSEEVRIARTEAEDGSLDSLCRSLMRKQMLTSWQIEKLMKGETEGYFFGDAVVMFHLAEGTFARVYRGRKIHGNQAVAIKVLRQRFASDQAAVGRFNKEAEAGLKLSHVNIVRIFDFGEHDRRHYMTMEYVEGSNLRDFLKFRTRLKPAEALPLMLGLARGLQYSLSRGVTHRDIKPTNILISSSGVAKLVDFGLATIEGDEKKMTAAHGQRTVDYSNLERNCGSPKGDPRSDLFFLGCVYYQMLTGQNPMPEADSKDPLTKWLRRNINAIKPISEHTHAPPDEMSRIIETMMKVDLKHRYQTMDAVVNDLEAFQASLASDAPAPKPAEVPEPEPEFTGFDEDDEGFEINDYEVPAFKSKDVLCVEAQNSIRDALNKALSGMGYNVQLAGDAEGAAQRFQESPPDVLLYDVDGLGPKALEIFLAIHKRANRDGRDLASLILLSPRQAELSGRLPKGDRLRILSKPLKMKDIQEALRQLVPIT